MEPEKMVGTVELDAVASLNRFNPRQSLSFVRLCSFDLIVAELWTLLARYCLMIPWPKHPV
jgi:hypothetical protein